MSKLIMLLSTSMVMILIWGLGMSSGIDSYISHIKSHPETSRETNSLDDVEFPVLGQPVGSGSTQKEWVRQIREEASSERIAPIDAKIDRVWKAIPGYNGLEVDLPKTLSLFNFPKSKDQPSFVYREIKPAINLEDLGAYPIYKGNPKKPMISLLINVAWGNEYIPSMLQVLNKENVHVTFFFDGSWLKNNLIMAKEIAREGHELSNHAYSHTNMSQLSRQEAIDEMMKTQRLLQNELGIHNSLFAPPSGDFNEQTIEIAHELHLKTILWTIDTLDWTQPAPEWILRKIESQLEPGSMILMHPTKAASLALKSIIIEVKKRGLAIGTVSQLISTQRVPATNVITQSKPTS